MSTTQTTHEDPLIAALPPQTDYITYLTLLEYQLTPANLHTLTDLLTNDDGTLASEIGWDLLKLVLPMSNEVPEEANKCLEVVARRGNPREVVVRVAEELERLDRADVAEYSGPDQDFEGEEDDDDLRTFAGEAERIHLGDMTLDGMPHSSNMTARRAEAVRNQGEELQSSSKDATASTQFQMLLSMLGFLHPRVQTKYPSRFLATSLPAGLAAYRRLPIDTMTTSAFLALLGKLSGKQRPALPPRTSTATISRAPPASKPDLATSSAPLPDPEAQDETALTSAISAEEDAIMQRLLQAVLLEVLEDYVQALAAQEPPYMSWTARVREKSEPARRVPGSTSEHQKWQESPALQDRDAIIARFVRAGKDLGIDIKDAVKKFLGTDTDAEDEPEGADAGSPAEYPTSPSQISFPKTGVLFLYIAVNVSFTLEAYPHPSGKVGVPEIFPDLVQLYEAFEDPTEHPALRTSPSPALLDGILALLYTSTQHGSLGSSSSIDSQFNSLMLSLTQLCSQNPDQYIRDSAHLIAASIFHQCPNPTLKTTLLKTIIQTSPIANLRAVAVKWLKDEFSKMTDTSLPPETLTSDFELTKALFSAPPITAPTADHALAQMPFYISVLNLLTLLLSAPNLSRLSNPLDQGKRLVDAVTTLRWNLSENEDEMGEQGLQMIDLWSLDDALQRVKDAFAKQGL